MDKLTEYEKNIIAALSKSLTLDTPPVINQEQFDLIIKELIKDDRREIMWRMCGAYPNFDYKDVIDHFVGKRDSWYVEELVSFVNGQLDQEYLVNKMIKTQDKEFIKEALNLCSYCMEGFLEPYLLKKLYLFLESYDR